MVVSKTEKGFLFHFGNFRRKSTPAHRIETYKDLVTGYLLNVSVYYLSQQKYKHD